VSLLLAYINVRSYLFARRFAVREMVLVVAHGQTQSDHGTSAWREMKGTGRGRWCYCVRGLKHPLADAFPANLLFVACCCTSPCTVL
jgi:hypothetical protein